MLTKDDLNKIQLLITDGLKPVIKDINEVKREIDGLKDEMEDVKGGIRLIPTKEEYFDSMDKLMGEIKKSREEQEVVGEELSRHSDRLEKLEEKVGINSPF